ncbi:MAG: hypothetical protein ACREPZ_00005 [Rhodanobacteraceae bacterium]
MRKTFGKRAAVRGARLAVLGAGVLLLAGCAAGYSFVQPGGAGSGGYYTSDGTYSGQGYYDYYGTGPYYSGTSGYGYYNGTRPYSSAYGYYGPGYGYGYDYGSQWIFNAGISNVWNFPGYWGPWYTTGFSSWGCGSWRCGNHHHSRHHRHDRGGGSWRHDDASSRPADIGETAQRPDFNAGRERAMEATAWRHDHYVRSPRQDSARNFGGIPAMPSYEGHAPRAASFGSRDARPASASVRMPAPQPASRAPRAMPQPSFRPAMPARPTAPASSRTGTNTGTKIR